MLDVIAGGVMIPLIFILGTLVGILAGGALCIRYLRREIAADIGPQLKRMQNQLDNIESAINLALVTRYADLSGSHYPPPLPAPRTGNDG